MSMAIGHFALGVGVSTAVLLAAKRQKKIGVDKTEPIRWGGGIWAMAPDIGKIIPSLDFLHNGWWADIFWFHRFLDTKIDPTDSALISFWLVFFMLAMLVIYWSAVFTNKEKR